MVWVPALIEVGLGTLALGPFLIHRLSVGRWRKNPPVYPSENTDSPTLPITVLLPVWNEASVIEQKLANLAKQDGASADLLIIDSASTDATVGLARQWLEQHPKAFNHTQIIEMETRLGKSRAVQIALETLEKQGLQDWCA